MKEFRFLETVSQLGIMSSLVTLSLLCVSCAKSSEANTDDGNDAGDQDTGVTPICELPFVAGPCEASIKVYWYNAKNGQCEPKTYGGCDGNDNRFESLADCKKACGSSTSDAGGHDAGGHDVGVTPLCELPFEVGPCDAAIQVYWFDAEKEKCEERIYGGCDGNDNRFSSLAACEQACGSSASDAGDHDTGIMPICKLPFVGGPCEADIPVFWYDAEKGQCEERTYGGCDGNDNRFDGLEACEQACGSSASDAGGHDAGATPLLCELPFVAGPCKAAIPVFWYNSENGQCEPKTYGGCDGNDNRFESVEACEQTCLDLSTVACESDADCGWGEIGHEILNANDCMCLYGCPYMPLNRTTINRRLEQYGKLCDPQHDGTGQICGIDDCVVPPTAECIEKRCTGDLYGGI